MKHDKAFYQDLPKVNGFRWAFYDNGLHSFTKKNGSGVSRVQDDRTRYSGSCSV